eukprot:COSAG03_NODE_16518_length_399_cov_1.036667_1_plen_105_part_10
MPLPMGIVIASGMRLPLGDDELFSWLNIVVLGWALIAFLPRWKHTPALSLAVVGAYALLYTVLLAERARSGPLPAGSGFGTLQGVVTLFTDRGAVMAGWTHYIAF